MNTQIKGFSVDYLAPLYLENNKSDVILVGEGVPEMHDVNLSEDYLVLVKRKYTLINQEISQLIAVPNSILKSGSSYMFGGKFIYTSDSRFTKLNNGNPIKVFDRVE